MNCDCSTMLQHGGMEVTSRVTKVIAVVACSWHWMETPDERHLYIFLDIDRAGASWPSFASLERRFRGVKKAHTCLRSVIEPSKALNGLVPRRQDRHHRPAIHWAGATRCSSAGRAVPRKQAHGRQAAPRLLANCWPPTPVLTAGSACVRRHQSVETPPAADNRSSDCAEDNKRAVRAKTCVLGFVMTLIGGQVTVMDGVRFPRSGHTRPNARAASSVFTWG
jgi:hypothetical protein